MPNYRFVGKLKNGNCVNVELLDCSDIIDAIEAFEFISDMNIQEEFDMAMLWNEEEFAGFVNV